MTFSSSRVLGRFAPLALALQLLAASASAQIALEAAAFSPPPDSKPVDGARLEDAFSPEVDALAAEWIGDLALVRGAEIDAEFRALLARIDAADLPAIARDRLVYESIVAVGGLDVAPPEAALVEVMERPSGAHYLVDGCRGWEERPFFPKADAATRALILLGEREGERLAAADLAARADPMEALMARLASEPTSPFWDGYLRRWLTGTDTPTRGEFLAMLGRGDARLAAALQRQRLNGTLSALEGAGEAATLLALAGSAPPSAAAAALDAWLRLEPADRSARLLALLRARRDELGAAILARLKPLDASEPGLVAEVERLVGSERLHLEAIDALARIAPERAQVLVRATLDREDATAGELKDAYLLAMRARARDEVRECGRAILARTTAAGADPAEVARLLALQSELNRWLSE